jgi:hypothetical protein
MANGTGIQKGKEPIRKVIGVPLRKEMQKESDGTLVVRGYFTSDNRDEVGDIITRSATERAIPKYRQWGNIRYMHLPKPVAKVLRIGIDDGLEWNEVEIKVIDPTTVFEVENGLLAALSVGILASWDDIDWLEDGGMIINDYTLAEISLVDHPANYDARLKDLPVDQGLRMLARQYGFDVLAKSMQTLLDRELAMTDQNVTENDAVETEPVEEGAEVQAAIEAAAPEVEQPDAEQPEAEAAQEAPAEEEAPVEAPVEEEVTDEPAAETSEEAPAAESDPMQEVLAAIRNLTALVERSLNSTPETPAEVPQATEQTEGGEDVEKDSALVAGTEEAVQTQTPEPANRKGAVQETELPGEGSVQAEKAEPVTDLRQALHKYFQAKHR